MKNNFNNDLPGESDLIRFVVNSIVNITRYPINIGWLLKSLDLLLNMVYNG